MKSIKEKAEEHAPYTRENSWIRTQKCIIAQTSFEAGANYVLEQIDKQLVEFSNFEDTLIISRTIEQLKK